MFQSYPETADNIHTVKAKPGNKWVRRLEKVPVCGCWDARSLPEYKCCPFIQARSQKRGYARLGTTETLWLWPGGSKSEGAAVVRSSGSSWGLGHSCPPSLALTAKRTTAGRDCHVALVSHCKTSWSLQLFEILVSWAVSHKKTWKRILQDDKNWECLYKTTDLGEGKRREIHNWDFFKRKKKK